MSEHESEQERPEEQEKQEDEREEGGGQHGHPGAQGHLEGDDTAHTENVGQSGL